MRWSAALMCLVSLAALAGCGAAETEPAAESVESAGPGAVTSSPPSSAPEPSPTKKPKRNPLADAVEGLEDEDLAPRGDPDAQVLGGDISWPQCPPGLGIPQKRSSGSPMPLPSAEYVVIGLTNGPGFYPNPCLADQVAYARDAGLLASAYAVASYPEPEQLARYGGQGPYDGSTRLGALANVGYQQARFNVASMAEAGLISPIVWIDVEPVPDFEWSSDLEANAVIVSAAARGYREAGYDVGVYSTPLLWSGVVGDLQLGVPEWRAAGQTSQQEALSRCGDDWVIQGGVAVLGQWVEDSRDRNVTCPGTAAELGRWFHQY